MSRAGGHSEPVETTGDEGPARSGSGEPRRALFNIDPGWLFIVAGLALCIAGVLIPAQRDLRDLDMQLHALQQRERIGNERLRAYAEFVFDLDREETRPEVTRRLAASQLNVLPAGDVPVIIAATDHAALTEWIDARVGSQHRLTAMRSQEPQPYPGSMLTRLATGPKRLWLLGGGVLSVFFGILLAPSSANKNQVFRRDVDRIDNRDGQDEDLRAGDAECLSTNEMEAADDFTDELELTDELEPQETTMLTLELAGISDTTDSVELSEAERDELECEVVVTRVGDARCAAD